MTVESKSKLQKYGLVAVILLVIAVPAVLLPILLGGGSSDGDSSDTTAAEKVRTKKTNCFDSGINCLL